jgi:hypothetical protein
MRDFSEFAQQGLLESRIRYEESGHRHLSQPVATSLGVDSRPRELPVWLIFALSVEASDFFLPKGKMATGVLIDCYDYGNHMLIVEGLKD